MTTFQGDPETVTLAEAKAWLRKLINDGAECPCCTQYAKVYPRKLNSLMARGLLWLVRQSGPQGEWVEYSKIGPQWLQKMGGTLALLVHWKLIEPKANDDSGKRASGVWRPTHLGQQFADGRVTVPKYAVTYSQRCLRLEGDDITIRDALGSQFNYEELMRGEG